MGIPTAYRKHKGIKKREYGQRVRDVEHDVLTTFVLSTTGGMGREGTAFYKRLADLIAQKQGKPYPMRCYGMVALSSIIFHPLFVDHVHSWQPFFLPSSHS